MLRIGCLKLYIPWFLHIHTLRRQSHYGEHFSKHIQSAYIHMELWRVVGQQHLATTHTHTRSHAHIPNYPDANSNRTTEPKKRGSVRKKMRGGTREKDPLWTLRYPTHRHTFGSSNLKLFSEIRCFHVMWNKCVLSLFFPSGCFFYILSFSVSLSFPLQLNFLALALVSRLETRFIKIKQRHCKVIRRGFAPRHSISTPSEAPLTRDQMQ